MLSIVSISSIQRDIVRTNLECTEMECTAMPSCRHQYASTRMKHPTKAPRVHLHAAMPVPVLQYRYCLRVSRDAVPRGSYPMHRCAHRRGLAYHANAVAEDGDLSGGALGGRSVGGHQGEAGQGLRERRADPGAAAVALRQPLRKGAEETLPPTGSALDGRLIAADQSSAQATRNCVYATASHIGQGPDCSPGSILPSAVYPSHFVPVRTSAPGCLTNPLRLVTVKLRLPV